MNTVAVKKFNGRGLIACFLKGSFALYLVSVVANLAVTALAVLIPEIVGVTVDSVIGDEPLSKVFAYIAGAFGGLQNLRENIWIIALAVLIIALFMAVFRYVQSYANVCANEKLMQRMRNLLFSRIQRLPLSWHSAHRTGDIIQRCTSDTQTILNFISNQMMQLFRIAAMTIMSLALMFIMDWKLALVAFAFIPFIVGYSLVFYSKVKRKFKQCDEEEGVLSNIAQENLTGARVVRAFGRERSERDKFEKQNTFYTGLWVRLERFLAMYWTSSDFFAALQLLFIISTGTVLCVNGNLTAGRFIAFISYNALLTVPIRQLGRIISNMSKAGVSLSRIGEIMNGVPEIYGDDCGKLSGDICYRGVSFGYEAGKNVLTDISFTLPQGKTLGIIGGTGSGKSTLLYLLDRLYAPTEGEISIGGRNIADVPLKTLRQNIGLVLQEGYLYSRTVGENISVTRPEAGFEEIRRAAETACVNDDIEGFAEGYDTIVGERGVTLSGGQRQRVCIARTLMRGAPYLVFDDSLSAVDSDTDAAIRENLFGQAGGATMIIVSHRVATVMRADLIIVMEKGRIAERGTHAELLEKGGIYRNIYDIQMNLPQELSREASDEIR